jgi:hypothetical protein
MNTGSYDPEPSEQEEAYIVRVIDSLITSRVSTRKR